MMLCLSLTPQVPRLGPAQDTGGEGATVSSTLVVADRELRGSHTGHKCYSPEVADVILPMTHQPALVTCRPHALQGPGGTASPAKCQRPAQKARDELHEPSRRACGPDLGIEVFIQAAAARLPALVVIPAPHAFAEAEHLKGRDTEWVLAVTQLTLHRKFSHNQFE